MEHKNTNSTVQPEEKGQEKSEKREKSVITLSAVLVMAALTLTGVYMSNKNNRNNNPEKVQDIGSEWSEDIAQMPEGENNLQVVDSATVKNPGRTGNVEETKENSDLQTEETENQTKKPATKSSHALVEKGTESTELENQAAMSAMTEAMTLSFNGIEMFDMLTEESQILIPYSMDKAVYFDTLDQYKYSPAMVIAAAEGTPVRAVSAGRIIDKYWDYETGWTYEMDMGGGFTAIYGQLENLQKSVDTYVAAGDILGYITTPTKYYIEEGCNLYFAMTRDGKPVYPMDYIGE